MVRDRLGIVPDEIYGGHLPALARPKNWSNGRKYFALFAGIDGPIYLRNPRATVAGWAT